LIGRALLLTALLVGSQLTAAEPTASPRVIRIVAKKFDFTPAEIHVRKGEHVVLELVSMDRKHGFKLPELEIRTDVLPGTSTRIEITPQKPGRYPFACDIFCGEGHEDMNGTLVVDP
jgi:cytochrome c oxidase subunit 2